LANKCKEEEEEKSLEPNEEPKPKTGLEHEEVYEKEPKKGNFFSSISATKAAKKPVVWSGCCGGLTCLLQDVVEEEVNKKSRNRSRGAAATAASPLKFARCPPIPLP